MTTAMKLSRLSVVLPLVAVCALGAACSSDGSSSSSSTTVVRTSSGGCASGALTEAPLLATPDTTPQTASYSNDPTAPQAKSCDGMRDYLSTPQPGWDLQSYVFYGHLKDSTGRIIAFSTLEQHQQVKTGSGPAADLQVAAVTVNQGSGITVGGLDGAPDQAVQVSATSNPFSLRSQSFTAPAGAPVHRRPCRGGPAGPARRGDRAHRPGRGRVARRPDGPRPQRHAGLGAAAGRGRRRPVGLRPGRLLPAVDLPEPAPGHHRHLWRLGREVPGRHERPDDRAGRLLLLVAGARGGVVLHHPERLGRGQRHRGRAHRRLREPVVRRQGLRHRRQRRGVDRVHHPARGRAQHEGGHGGPELGRHAALRRARPRRREAAGERLTGGVDALEHRRRAAHPRCERGVEEPPVGEELRHHLHRRTEGRRRHP